MIFNEWDDSVTTWHASGYDSAQQAIDWSITSYLYFALIEVEHRMKGKVFTRWEKCNQSQLGGDVKEVSTAPQVRHQAEVSLIITSWTHISPKQSLHRVEVHCLYWASGLVSSMASTRNNIFPIISPPHVWHSLLLFHVFSESCFKCLPP